MPVLTIDDVVIGEGPTVAIFTVRLDAAAATNVTVQYATSSGDADTNDYSSRSGTLNFAPGDLSKTISIPITDDIGIEGNHSFFLSLSNAIGAVIGREDGVATIIDNDGVAGTPNITISDPIVDERGRVAAFEISLDRPASAPVSFSFTTQNGTATAGNDFQTTSGNSSFSVGQTSKTIYVPIINDAALENGEGFSLVLSNVVGAGAVDLRGAATIAASDQTAVASTVITVSDAVVGEGQGFAEFIVRLNAPDTDVVEVDYSTLSGNADTNDYQPVSGTLAFAPGETVRTIRVPVVGDNFSEGNQSFFLSLSNAIGAVIGREDGVATIVDNDGTAGTPDITISDPIIDETDGIAAFTIPLDRPATAAVTFNYTTADGTASAGSDYQQTSGSLIFAQGETAKTIYVPIINDAALENGEGFSLVLSNVVGAGAVDLRGAATIAASDQTAVASTVITVSDAVVGEGQGFAEFIVRLNAPDTDVVEVDYSTLSGNADTNDYQPVSGTLAFAPGETVRTIRVPVVGDNFSEGNQSFFLSLSNAIGAVIGREDGVATIVDNDGTAGTPNITISDPIVDETDGIARFVVSLDRPASGAVSISYSTQNGTAIGDGDFAPVFGTLVFALGETAKTVDVAIHNDTNDETSEVLGLQFSSVVGGNLADAVGFAIIHTSDQVAVVTSSISVDDVTVGEGQAFAEFIDRLNAPDTGVVEVDYSMLSGNADTNDYQPVSGTLAFAPGETVRTIRVPVVGDNFSEGNQSFFLELFNASGATISRDVATATIIDDDDVGPDGGSSFFGTFGDDVLLGSAFDDTLSGDAGNDVLNGKSGSDQYIGGAGDDTYIVSDVTDSYTEQLNEGIDTVLSSDSSHILLSNTENLILIGSAVSGTGNGIANTLTGNTLNNFLVGAGGNDTIDGGNGDDVIDGGNGNDAMRGGQGDDTFTIRDAGDGIIELANQGIDTARTTIDYTLTNNVERLSLLGGARLGTGNALDNTLTGAGGADTLTGLNGNDTLRGQIGRDILLGGNGADLLDGGAGKDTLTGGAGKDTFQFRFASDFNNTRPFADTITDFDQGLAERIQLNAIDANINTGTNDDFEWIAGNAFSNTAGQMRFEQSGGDTYIEGDADGDGVADLVIRLTGLYNLTANDIIGANDLLPNRDGVALPVYASALGAVGNVSSNPDGDYLWV